MPADTVVLGLDGATWSLLDPWIEKGELPTFKKLKQDSTWGYNKSGLPPSTFPNWKCYSTGKNPGKFGTYWFENVDIEEGKITVPDSQSFKSPELWDYLSDEGLRVGVLNMPTTYPPKEVNGYVVAGGPRSGASGYTSPEELEPEIEKELNYRVHPRKAPINKDDSNEEAIQEHLDVIDLRFDLLERMLKEDLDFIHMTIFHINVLQHFFGDAESVLRGWKLIDERLATILDKCENLVIMSDHGSGDIHTVFWINTWLENHGYLQTKSGFSDRFFSQIGTYRDSILSLARTVGLESAIRRFTPEFIQMRVQQGGVHQKNSKDQIIDWEKSKAIASGQGPVYLNRNLLSDHEYEQLRHELQDKISDIKSPLTGKSIANDVHLKENVYSGPYLDDAPDIVVEQTDGVHIDGGVGRETVFEKPSKWQAENYRTGLFVFNSKYCKTDEKVGEIEIVDLAPTILHMLGLPVPNDMDGKVRTEVFTESSKMSSSPINYRQPLKLSGNRVVGIDQDAAKDRLKDLGYLS